MLCAIGMKGGFLSQAGGRLLLLETVWSADATCEFCLLYAHSTLLQGGGSQKDLKLSKNEGGLDMLTSSRGSRKIHSWIFPIPSLFE